MTGDISLDLGDLGLDRGGHLLVKRALGHLPAGGRLSVFGRHPDLGGAPVAPGAGPRATRSTFRRLDWRAVPWRASRAAPRKRDAGEAPSRPGVRTHRSRARSSSGRRLAGGSRRAAPQVECGQPVVRVRARRKATWSGRTRPRACTHRPPRRSGIRRPRSPGTAPIDASTRDRGRRRPGDDVPRRERDRRAARARALPRRGSIPTSAR